MSEATPLQPEQTFARGRFVLVKRLGRGGMGEVWLARDERLQEQVALKFLPPEIRGDAGALDDLRRETARSHQLSHPNIVRIHDLYEDPDGMAFIVMEYIEGPTLAALRIQQPAQVLPWEPNIPKYCHVSTLRLQQRSGVLSWEYLRPLLAQLCAALEYAHGEKVIHRDLKPANLMVDSRGRLKLADFGIAVAASDSMHRVSAKHSTSGTLPYMSPQQVTGQRPQAADDLYALGATLYELLTGQPPFHSGDITHQVLHQAPEPVEDRLAALGIQNAIPPDAAALIMACLAKEPGQRPQSARAVAEWIGLELDAKPSAESLAAALFPETPSSPGALAGEPAGKDYFTLADSGEPPIPLGMLETKEVSRPAVFRRNLAAIGIVALVMAGAFCLRKAGHRGDHSNAPVAAGIPVQTAAVTNSAAPADLRRGLVLYFSFNKAPEDGLVRDESGAGNDGRVVNVLWTAQGRRGGAFQFSRSNSYITVPNNASLNPPRITLAAWVKTSYSDDAYRRIFDKGCWEGFALSEGGDYYGNDKLHYRNTGQLIWEIGGGTSVPHSIGSQKQRIDDGLWHHMAATYDGAVQSIYLDGLMLPAQGRWRGGIPANHYDLTIAANRSNPASSPAPGAAGASFDGLMDEVMMFNRALSPAEVHQLYQLSSSPEAAANPLPASATAGASEPGQR